MSTLNAETPASEGGLTDPFAARAFPRWRTVKNYGVQMVSLVLFFGIGLGVTLIAPLVRMGFSRSASGQEFVQSVYRFYCGWLRWSGMFRIRFEGCGQLEKLRGAIIAPNHPGLLDAIILIGRVPRAVCIMRAGLMRNPCIAGTAWLAGYIRNDRGAGLIRDCRRKLAEGDNLLIFPEGTRTRADARGVNPFKSGFALAAVLSGAPIQTVFIERSGVYLGKGTSLIAAANVPIEITIRTGEVFHARPGESAKELSSRLETYFRAHLANTDDGIRLRA